MQADKAVGYPATATSGKILTPIPIFSWERGQKLGQNLLSLQPAL